VDVSTRNAFGDAFAAMRIATHVTHEPLAAIKPRINNGANLGDLFGDMN
jgi:hypothetical protein